MRLPNSSTLTFAALLLTASLAVPTGAAAATKKVAVPCYDAAKATWTYPTKPKTCVTYDPATIELVPLEVTGLKWTNWGKKRATGKGSGKGEGYSGRLDVEVRGLKRCTSSLSIYSRVVVSIPKRGIVAQHTGLPCPPK